MASDLKVDIDGSRLNVRVGAIIRHNNQVIIEISDIGRNSVVPGGRIHINEHSCDALVRELEEEMNYTFDKNKFKQTKVFENFFEYDGKKFHEIYFLYEYVLSETEYQDIKNTKANKDNSTTHFEFVSKFDMLKYNVLPLELHPLIEK